MGKKVALTLLAIAALAVYMTFQEEGDEAFGGVGKPLESARGEGLPRTDWLTGQPIGTPTGRPTSMPTGGTNYEPVLDKIRNDLDDAMDRSVERSSRY